MAGMVSIPDNWEQIKSLFQQAIELDPAEQASFLLEKAPDPVVRVEVERLLLEYQEAGGFLSKPLIGDVTPPPLVNRFAAGDLLAGRFKIIRFIAAGGMGEVYEAFDLELRENLAIKTILAEAVRDPKAISAFRREVHLARRVTHPNVCRIFDIFRTENPEHADTLFVTMELLKGKTLAQQLKQGGAFAPVQAAPLVRQLASALMSAHHAGVVHRDLKPGNIFLVDPPTPEGAIRAVITDFGLAVRSLDPSKPLATLNSLSTDRDIRGTPAYMAPEQLQGQGATAASDVYALGVVVYEMVVGVHPFPESSIPLLIASILTKQPRSPSQANPKLTPHLDAVILKSLEKDPVIRYASIESFTNDLDRAWSPDSQASTAQALAVRRPTTNIYARWILWLLLLIALATLGRLGYRRFIASSESRTTHSSATNVSFFIVAQSYHDGIATGEPFPVSDQQAFTQGMGIHFVFNSNQSGYLYLVNEGPESTESSATFNVLFPTPFANGGSAQVSSGRDISIPATGGLVFDNRRGVEKIWIIWSKQSLPALESLQKWANEQDRGRIPDLSQIHELQTFLTQSESSPPEVRRDSNNRTNLASSSDRIVYLLSLHHL
jgi:serine/threonine protein kinase